MLIRNINRKIDLLMVGIRIGLAHGFPDGFGLVGTQGKRYASIQASSCTIHISYWNMSTSIDFLQSIRHFRQVLLVN